MEATFSLVIIVLLITVVLGNVFGVGQRRQAGDAAWAVASPELLDGVATGGAVPGRVFAIWTRWGTMTHAAMLWTLRTRVGEVGRLRTCDTKPASHAANCGNADKQRVAGDPAPSARG